MFTGIIEAIGSIRAMTPKGGDVRVYVANEQRKVIYHMRNSLLAAESVGDTIAEFREEVLTAAINSHIPPQSMPEQWDVAGLEATLQSDFGIKLPIQQWLDEDDKLYEETLRERILVELLAAYNEKETQASAEALRTFEKQILLRVLDDLWKDHLSTMDHLRHGIHLRGYAQKNPKQEYKRESFALFQELLESIKRDTIRVLSHVQVRREDPAEEEARLRREAEADGCAQPQYPQRLHRRCAVPGRSRASPDHGCAEHLPER